MDTYNKQSKSFLCNDLTPDQIGIIKSLGGNVLLDSGHSRYPFEFKKGDFAELCGWIISEGHLGNTPEKIYDNGNHRGLDYRVTITQEFDFGNPRGQVYRQEITNLLSKMTLRYKQYSHGFKIANPALHRFCVQEIRKGARNKQVPSVFVNSSAYVKRRLIDSLYKGDGSFRDPVYTTASATLADQVCCLMAELGYRSKKVFDERGKVFRVWCYNSAVGLTGHNAAEKSMWLTKEKFSGLVYCVTTKKNHTVFAGRNGIFVPVGQSYGVLGFESFPLYCLPAAEAVAALGRLAITKTIEKCRELGIDVVYSDTDRLVYPSPLAGANQ